VTNCNAYQAEEGQIIMSAIEELGITAFDAADYLRTEEAQTAFLNDAVESGDPRVLANALGAIARAQSRANGMGELARATGIKRQTLNKSLGPKGNPTVDTLFPVLRALGLRMKFEQAGKVRRKTTTHRSRKVARPAMRA
jgi:probable addiction module antidote protein